MEVANLAASSYSLSLSVGIMPPFATFPRMELQTSASLPGQKRQKSGASYPPLFFFLPFPASFLFLPSFLLFLSNIVGTTLMPTECNRRKFSFPGKFSSQNDRAEQRFPHRLDINEGTLKSRRRKDVRTKQFR